jgi:hypothetical protein
MTKLKKIEKICCKFKSYLLVLSLFLIATTVSLAQISSNDLEIVKRTTDKIEFKFSNENEGREVIIVFRESNIAQIPPNNELDYKPWMDYNNIPTESQTGEKNMVIFNGALTSEQFIVPNLEHNTDYAINLYTLNNSDSLISESSFRVSTLANEPTEQVKRVLNSVPKNGNMIVQYEKGNGEFSFLLIGEEKEPTMPEDGKYFEFDNDIQLTGKIDDHTFIISTDNKTSFSVSNLGYSTLYYLTAIEANGKNDKVNYLITDFVIRSVVTQPNPPLNLTVFPEKGNRFKLIWEKPDYVLEYELDVSLDPSFNKLLDKYNSIKFGDTDKFIITGIEKNTDYFIRMRSINKNGYSVYTDTLVGRLE